MGKVPRARGVGKSAHWCDLEGVARSKQSYAQKRCEL